ncbi:MAG TPA: hypothetical protein VFA74_02020 [Terriglobales bacterium]|nr:hypothetical protein [Terriglobales bacterium]
MKVFAAFSTAALLFSLVSITPAFAQEERHDEAAPAAHQEEAKPEHQEAKPEHQEARPEHQEAAPANQPARQEEARPARPENGNAGKQDDRAMHQQDNNSRQEARPSENDAHRNDARPAQNSGHMEEAHNNRGGGGHIPEDRFRSNFGRPHTFRVGHPIVVEGRPRFQYSGYWFEFADPWPADWSYDDDCYIDYVDDEYYLFDPRYPGMRIALIVIS